MNKAHEGTVLAVSGEASPGETSPGEASLAQPPWRAFVELAKPNITLMVVLTTAVGFVLASPARVEWLLLLNTIVGTALVASGASAFNMIVEREVDARMRRTARRPLPSGRLAPMPALVFASAISLAGVGYLAFTVNGLTAILGAVTLVGYVAVYTPMKRVSSLATIVGAVPGAIPPMMGVTAALGYADSVAWSLFGILFLWQMPHFLAIAWLYRSDYERGGFPMLSVIDPDGRRTARQMVLYAAALVPVSLLPSALGTVGMIYAAGALAAGVVFLAYCWAFAFGVSLKAARKVLLVSVMYLPVVLGLLVLDRALALG